MGELIDRQAAIDYINRAIPNWSQDKETALDCLKNMPSEHRKLDEWCIDCKEYDQERHCCPRWNRVIRNTVEELKAEHAKEAPQRMHGRWIERIEDMDGMKLQIMRCSECGSSKPMKLFSLENYEFNFCPNCGCAMTEGAES